MKTKKLDNMIIFMIAIFCLLTSFFNAGINIAFADNITYSNVLEDLQKDEAFNVEDYPVIENDYSLNVIQIAESVNNELFVYVYQPSADKEIVATSISMSTETGDNASWHLYDLSLVNCDSVFYKYKLEDFFVKHDSVRNYNISSIYRKWNADYDLDVNNDNTVNEVSFEVAQEWTASTVDNEVVYTCVEVETVNITDKYLGFLRYVNGWAWTTYYCDSHYVAFSTDKPMDKIIEAELSFVIYEYGTLYDVPVLDPEDRDKTKDIDMHVVLTNDEKVENQTIGLFGEQYDWCRIETVSEFIINEDLTEETKAYVYDKQWVLRFYETEYEHSGGNLGNLHGTGTGVAEVTVLRLKFETDGVVYNLGVVDNKQSGDNEPSNKVEDPLLTLFEKILIAIAIIVGLSILAPFLPTILTFLGKCVISIFKAIWWIITIPFEIFKDKDKK